MVLSGMIKKEFCADLKGQETSCECNSLSDNYKEDEDGKFITSKVTRKIKLETK